MRECVVCEGPIPSDKRLGAVYCSKICKSRVENKKYYKPVKRHNTKCLVCRNRIPTTRQATAKYCSKYCKLKANRQHHSSQRDAQKRGNAGSLVVSNKEWEKLKNRFGQCCAYCKLKKPLERDHVIPLSRGGRHAIANILPACRQCNMSKKNKLLAEWRYLTRYRCTCKL